MESWILFIYLAKFKALLYSKMDSIHGGGYVEVAGGIMDTKWCGYYFNDVFIFILLPNNIPVTNRVWKYLRLGYYLVTSIN